MGREARFARLARCARCAPHGLKKRLPAGGGKATEPARLVPRKQIAGEQEQLVCGGCNSQRLSR